MERLQLQLVCCECLQDENEAFPTATRCRVCYSPTGLPSAGTSGSCQNSGPPRLGALQYASAVPRSCNLSYCSTGVQASRCWLYDCLIGPRIFQSMCISVIARDKTSRPTAQSKPNNSLISKWKAGRVYPPLQDCRTSRPPSPQQAPHQQWVL